MLMTEFSETRYPGGVGSLQNACRRVILRELRIENVLELIEFFEQVT